MHAQVSYTAAAKADVPSFVASVSAARQHDTYRRPNGLAAQARLWQRTRPPERPTRESIREQVDVVRRT